MMKYDSIQIKMQTLMAPYSNLGSGANVCLRSMVCPLVSSSENMDSCHSALSQEQNSFLSSFSTLICQVQSGAWLICCSSNIFKYCLSGLTGLPGLLASADHKRFWSTIDVITLLNTPFPKENRLSSVMQVEVMRNSSSLHEAFKLFSLRAQ